MRVVLRSVVSAVGLGALALGCGGSPALRAAERGDMAALRAELGAREKAGNLTNGEAAKVARAVADRELRAAKGEDAAKRVREARACAVEMEGALEERTRTHDLAGAEAAMALYDDGSLGRSRARDWVGDADDAWRAIGTRTLTREDDAPLRRKGFTDPGPRTRRAAMRAAAEAGDAREEAALLEAARLDPEPIVRTEALRAAIAVSEGGAGLVTRLRDLWQAQSGDDGLREDIAVAWALPKLYAGGGREALAVLITGGAGAGAGRIAGAGAVLRAPHADKELAASAAALLARTVESASHRERLHALAIMPLGDPALVAAVAKAAGEGEVDPVVRVAALSRLTHVKERREAAVRDLEALARKIAPGEDSDVARRARMALAHAGDLRVQAWLEEDLGAKDPSARLEAASALAALGRAARGAPLLADADASVRTRAACTLIAAAR